MEYQYQLIVIYYLSHYYNVWLEFSEVNKTHKHLGDPR